MIVAEKMRKIIKIRLILQFLMSLKAYILRRFTGNRASNDPNVVYVSWLYEILLF